MDAIFTIDVEDWFNILDTPVAPPIEKWGEMESRFEPCLRKLLSLLNKYGQKCTLFWLGWFAERKPNLVLECRDAGHEIGSHGYGHVLAYSVGRAAFREDIRRGKAVLEQIIGEKVHGFRAAGFSTLDDTTWTFEEIKAAGYEYDSSIFPASRGHGGMTSGLLSPHVIQTHAGPLAEFPQSMVTILTKRVSLFGGGYLRLSPPWLIRKGVAFLKKNKCPLIVYVHPREVDPAHPRLPLSALRRFKCYANLHTTYPKLETLCANYSFLPMWTHALKLLDSHTAKAHIT